MVAVGLAVWSAAAYMIPLAVTAGDRVDRLTSVSSSSLYGPDPVGLESLRRDVDDLRSDLSATTIAFRWVGQMSKGLSWVPLLERELTSWEIAATRDERNVEAARALIAGDEAMTGASGAVGVAFSGDAVENTKRTVDKARDEFTRATDLLDHGWPRSNPGGVALGLPGVRSSMDRIRSVETRMIAAGGVGLATTDLLDVALEIAEQAKPIVGPILGGNDSELPDSNDLASILAAIEGSSEEAERLVGRIADMLDGLGDVDALRSDLAALNILLASTGDLTSAAGMGIEVLRPVLDLASDEARGLLSGEGLAAALDSIAQNVERLDVAIEQSEAVADSLDELQREGVSSLLRGPVSDLAAAARSFHEGLGLVSGLSSIGGTLFGTDADRSYLVLGQSADELRATGGFVSAVWVIALSQGAIEQVEYFDVVRVDDFDRIALYPVGPPGLEEHMNGWVWLMRDVSWDPDFPTSAVTAQDIFKLGQRRTVDGVIAINQWGMLELVQALGSVASPDRGEPITQRNFLSLMERGTDEHGRSYSDLVVRGLFDSLKRPQGLSQLLDIASATLRALQSRDLMIQVNDEDATEVIRAQGWSGELLAVDHDYLGVFDSNVGWSKVDRNIQRNLDYAVDLADPASPRASLRLSYQNHSDSGSPPCEPQWRYRGTDYSTLKNACYWNYVRVLMPEGVRLLANSELPLPGQSVSVEAGFGTPDQETARLSAGHGMTVFSGLAIVEAGTSREIVLAYDLPGSTLEVEEGRLTYRLLLQKQPGVPRRGISVELKAPEGFSLDSASSEPSVQTAATVRFEFSQTNDILLEVIFTSPAAVNARN